MKNLMLSVRRMKAKVSNIKDLMRARLAREMKKRSGKER